MNTYRLVLPLVFVLNSAFAFENHFDAQGRLERMELGPGWMDLHAQVKIASKNWSKIFEFQKKKVEFAEKDGKKNWGGRIGDGENIDVEVVQTVTQEATGLTFDFKTSALKDSDMEALVFWIDVPASLFAKGSYRTEGKDSSY